jgi:hypothetical protein
MSSGWTTYLVNKIEDHVLGGGSYTRPATVYVALFTARGTVAQANAGTNFTEVATGAYARVAVTNNATNWPAASAKAKSNDTDVVFPEATADWGTVTCWGLYDASTAGNLLYWGDLTVNRTITTGIVAKFPAGSLDITEASA